MFKIFSREVLKQLPEGRGAWEACLPEGIAERIIENRLFGYPPPPPPDHEIAPASRKDAMRPAS